ncbi:proline dehydrogenase family protein [Gemmatimonadota bacterium]
MGLTRQILLRASTSRLLAEYLPRLRFIRRAVKRFVPGEQIEDALTEAARLGQEGFSTVITYLGEYVNDAVEAKAVTDRYLDVLDRTAKQELDAQISVKLTQLGLDIDPELCRENLGQLAAKASETGSMVWIDMESSDCTDVTLEIYREVSAAGGKAGICLQSYLRRTAGDLAGLLDRGRAIRLVKGAYREPPAISFPAKREVDDMFRELAHAIMKGGGDTGLLALGTHDDRLVESILAGRGSDRRQVQVEIQMLYGIRVESQRHWLSEGIPVRILLSYGEAWYPWYVRRLAERPANLWFVLRNLFGIFSS